MAKSYSGWDLCRNEIYHRLSETDKRIDELTNAIKSLAEKINDESVNHKLFEGEMRLKSSISGAIAGSVPALVVIVLWVLKEVLLK